MDIWYSIQQDISQLVQTCFKSAPLKLNLLAVNPAKTPKKKVRLMSSATHVQICILILYNL